MKLKHLGLVVLLYCVFSTSVSGAEQGSQTSPTIRSGKLNISGKLNYLGEMVNARDNGALINLKDDVGAALEIGYNFTEHLNVSFEFSRNSVGYDGVLVTGKPIAQDSIFGNVLDITNSQINFTYFLLNAEFTPFVSTGFGWAYIQSNVDKVKRDENCGRDSSYDYVCDGRHDIDTNFDFIYNARAGFRWNFNRQMYIGGSYSRQWFAFDNAETADSEVIQIQIGFYY